MSVGLVYVSWLGLRQLAWFMSVGLVYVSWLGLRQLAYLVNFR
jgi:hypothetical protein